MKKENNNEYLNHLDEQLKRYYGISYDEFEQLSFDEQERLVEERRRKNKHKSDTVTVMIGSGENAMFIRKKRGERYMLFDGTMVRAGDSPEQYRARIEDKYDDLMYSKPVAFVKKLTRRIKKK